MTIVDERENGFERKFVNEAELEFHARARRNLMLGEWAARLMGLQQVDDYAAAVVKVDLEQKGDDDVLRKVSQDLTGAGLPTSLGEIHGRMEEFLAVARDQLKAGT